MILSFEDKVICLSTIRQMGMAVATNLLSNIKRTPAVRLREQLNDLDTRHYLLEDGFVEKTSLNTIQYVQCRCPGQPTTLTVEYLKGLKASKQDELAEALIFLRAENLIHSFRPGAIAPRKTKDAASQEN